MYMFVFFQAIVYGFAATMLAGLTAWALATGIRAFFKFIRG